MKKLSKPFFLLSLIILLFISASLYIEFKKARLKHEVERYAGTESCRPCHEKFYQLWAPSHHGLAMQPVTSDFIERELILFSGNIAVGENSFRVEIRNGSLYFIESQGEKILNSYMALHAMGGKYVYYFLTELDKGRLQVLPLAYDCKEEVWYNNPESGVRHFETGDDSPLSWTSHLFTFNTSCYNCHVSQLNTNFDTISLGYNTLWKEPGINCETCHGPSAEHIRVSVAAGEGNRPDDLKIIVTGEFTSDQHNSSCGSCHAKGVPIAESYIPGAPFFDYFDINTLEDPDFYPDGRDLGENYTMTGWMMNSCVDNSDLHCVNCHTSSGRYKFASENRNGACLPCHKEKVDNPETHTSHKADSEGSICISCHMPKTTFARMERSDHSFRPPMPGASMQFGSPNACNICHSDRSAEWANNEIHKTHPREYQTRTIDAGILIVAARERVWESAYKICEGIEEGLYDDIYTTSFLRLLENIDNPVKWPAVFKMTDHDSPLVRSAAAHSLAKLQTRESFNKLVDLANDPLRLVRLSAAWSLSNFPDEFISPSNEIFVRDAISDYIKSQKIRPDDWASHYNLGNFYRNIGDYKAAINEYTKSVMLYPEAVMPLINAGYLYGLAGDFQRSERLFQDALVLEPGHEGALLNLALLYGDMGDYENAAACYYQLLSSDSSNSVAAYNLSIIISEKDLEEAIYLSDLASTLNPENGRYRYTNALFLYRAGELEKSLSLLGALITDNPDYSDPYLLISRIYIEIGDFKRAREILTLVIESKEMPMEIKRSALQLLGEF